MPEDATQIQTESPLTDLGQFARYQRSQVRAYFDLLHESKIEETQTTYRVHWLAHDANSRPRTKDLARFLYTRITDYCIPRSRIIEAQLLDMASNSTEAVAALQQEANELFSDADPSGEGGELLLYFLLEAELDIPQILAKMPLKTNSRMPIHGVDGVHAAINDQNQLAVYWGESKLYSDFSSALSECFDSIAPFLLDDGSGPAHRDLSLVRENLDIGDREVSLRLVKYFTDDQPERLDLLVSGACLVAFNHDTFAPPFEKDNKSVLADVQERIDSWSRSLAQRARTRSVQTLNIEFFCLPLPDVVLLRTEFRRLLGHS